MQFIAVALLAVVAAANAGGLTGYGSSNFVQHAHVAQPVAVAQPAFAVRAAPAYATYAQAAPAFATYAQAAPVAYAHAPVVAKTIVPAAQSYAYNNRAPAAKLAVGVSPVAAYAAGPVAYGAGPVAYGAGPVAYGAGPVAYGAGPVAYGAGPIAYGAGPIAYGAGHALL